MTITSRIFRSILIPVTVLAMLCAIAIEPLVAQIPKSTRRWIRVGSLQHFVSAYGTERAWNNVYYEGMIWPAEYKFTDTFVIKRAWVGVTDFTDENGVPWPYKATAFYRGEEYYRNTAMELRQVAKFEPPTVFVDGSNVTAIYAGQVDTVDANIKPDRIVTNVVRTDIGLTMTRRFMAFSQQYHDDYMIVEYTFENTGNTDADDEIELEEQTLTGLRMGNLTHHTASREAATVTKGRVTWGANQWQSIRGEDDNYANWLLGDPSGDSLRIAFTWMGQDHEMDISSIGAPDTKKRGRLTGSQHVGIGILHVDTDGADSTDNPRQPSTMGWNGNDNAPGMGAVDQTSMREAYDMLAGQMLKGETSRMDEQHMTNDMTPPNPLADAGGAATMLGYGPFDLAFGESIRIVEVIMAGGLSRQMNEQVGRTWKSGSAPFILPDNSTTDDKDEYKNQWVYTGADSLFKTMSLARRNYELGYDIPQPPQPPQIFSVNSGGDRISLSWLPADGVEGYPNFGGYRIYRAVSKTDTVYEAIFECGPDTDNPEIVHEYDDMTPIRGFSYYYYIVAFSDGSLNQTAANPHGQLESSRFYTQTTKPAYLRRPAGKALEDVRVVPNPYYINARGFHSRMMYYDLPDRIMFLNIPGKCTIRIFTERGDLIDTIEHTDGSGDEPWDSITKYRQVIVSGVYIAHIETPAGESIVRKFTVIR